MLFNSFEFAIFLPIVLLCYWLLNRSLILQNFYIVFVSYIFYGWWDWRFLLIIFITSIVSYYCGIKIDNSDTPKKRKLYNLINIVFGLSILGVFKYYNFFIESFIGAFDNLGIKMHSYSLNIILPVGISFYTFHNIGYTVDIYNNKSKATRNLIAYLGFVSFFPQLVAGPIERSTSLLPQFFKKREFNYEEAIDGLRQGLWGLFKKIVIADNCAIIVNQVFDSYSSYSGSELFIVAILFAFQIYGDFSGYSDMAVGIAKLFGFKLIQNFSLPYFATSIADFWRRWHISLSTWFRDYIYIPLGGNRGNKFMKARNVLILFTISGFWHGANWTYIVWGIYHGLLFMPSIIFPESINKINSYTGIKYIANVLGTFLLVTMGWILFRADSFTTAFNFFRRIASKSLLDFPKIILQPNYILIIAFIGILILAEFLQRGKNHVLDIAYLKLPRYFNWGVYYVVLLAVFAYGGKQSAFIYFKF